MARSFLWGIWQFLREETVLILAGFCRTNPISFSCWPQSLLLVMILSASRESVWLCLHTEHWCWLDSAPSGCHTGPSLSCNAECCLGFQQCPYLWSFRQAKPLTSSWPLQPRTASGAIRCLPWFPLGRRRCCSNGSLTPATCRSVKHGLPVSVFIRVVAIL